MRIDAHQHFWKYDPVKDTWITDDMKRIRHDFLPRDLNNILKQNSFEGCVAVQVDQSESETHYLLELARQNDFIKGVVGWIDLRAPKLAQRLKYFSQFEILKGFRHIVQAELEDDFLLREDFCRGVSLLSNFNFTYDILIYPRHLPYARSFVEKFPDQKFVVDHLAKPRIKELAIDEWRKEIQLLSRYDNVFCKISGMVTEAAWDSWTYESFVPYLDIIANCFGTTRIMYGSDWPVCLLAASYQDQLAPYQLYFRDFSTREKENVFGNNACKFYNLH